MELGDGEARVCRLCGQCENICIDVFGEEGVRRFLSLKIHTKVNILIDEKDPLPKAICIHCLGKLEFVCDFQEECLRTQRALCDQCTPPCLTEIDQVKAEAAGQSTSTYNNNEDDQDFTSSDEDSIDDENHNIISTSNSNQISEDSQQQEESSGEAEEDQNSAHSSNANTLINTIESSSLTDASSVNLEDSTEFEQKWQASQNPQELFRVDGEEVRVDDNVEQVSTDNRNGYSCKLCRKFYERKNKCIVHVKTHLGIKQYTCVVYNARFVCKSDVLKHIRCSHTNPRPIQCPKCPKKFKSKFYLMEHDNVHKGVKPYSCADCGQSYYHKVSLQIHVKSHLPPQNLACEYCGKVFPYRSRLSGHIASVHTKNRREFRCRFCYNLYSSPSVLEEHIKTRHATTYTCEICSKTFKVASKYKAHVLHHSNPKPFVCNICNNRYASKTFLNEHLLKHEGLRKHICQECGAKFAQASHLAAHRHVHGEKKHACPECGRKFNRRDNMKVHRRRHFEGKKTDISKEKDASISDVASSVSNEK